MRPRLVLHLAALVLPVAAVLVTALVLGPGWLYSARNAWLDMGSLCAAAVLAAQAAAAICAPLLWRTGSRWLVPLAAGFGMALLTHGLFAPLSLLFMGWANDGIRLDEVLKGAPFIAAMSVVFVGWISAPLTMAVSVIVSRLRRREIGEVAAIPAQESRAVAEEPAA